MPNATVITPPLMRLIQWLTIGITQLNEVKLEPIQSGLVNQEFLINGATS